MNSKALSLLVMLGLVTPLGACGSPEGGEQVEEKAPTAPAQVDDEGGEDGAATPAVKDDNKDDDGDKESGAKTSDKDEEGEDDEGGEGGEG